MQNTYLSLLAQLERCLKSLWGDFTWQLIAKLICMCSPLVFATDLAKVFFIILSLLTATTINTNLNKSFLKQNL